MHFLRYYPVAWLLQAINFMSNSALDTFWASQCSCCLKSLGVEITAKEYAFRQHLPQYDWKQAEVNLGLNNASNYDKVHESWVI